jgi:hypothetical protein
MSLINDALKKAQRDRDPLAPTDALGAGPSGRSKARTPAQHWLLVLGSGALVLVVLSVAFTLFWTTPDAPPRKAAAVAPAAPPTRGFNPRLPTTPQAPRGGGAGQVPLMYPAMFPNDPISALLQQRAASLGGQPPQQ